jgi:hypothetical protein
MSFLSKSLTPGQAIRITVDADADIAELEQRMQTDGIRIRVADHKASRTKINTRAPAGITPEFIGEADLHGSLALSRACTDEIVITIKPGAVPADAMAAFAKEGVLLGLAESYSTQAALRVKAPKELLVLREELTE